MSFLNQIKKVAAIRAGKPIVEEVAPENKLQLLMQEPKQKSAIATNGVAGGCSGCGQGAPAPTTPTINPTFLGNLKDLTGSLRDMAAYITGEKTTEEEFEKRKSACESCPAKDSAGRLLFREFRTTWFSCGALRTENTLRDSSKDGCGCVLNVKWASKPQKCPLKEPRW